MAPSSTTEGGKGSRSGKIRACAECRRLKLRCDRNIPCQSCIRRGCTALCPDKCFTDEATPSSLKATSLRNREQIQFLTQRVAALEEALASSQPSHSLLVKTDVPSLTSTAAAILGSEAIENNTSVDETIDIFGSLSLGEDGHPVYHGATSLSENFLRRGFDDIDHRTMLLTGDQPVLPPSLQLLSALFPFTPRTIAGSSDINEMLPYLPSAPVALETTNRYWYQLSLGCAPISRNQFMKNIYDHFYPNNVLITHLELSDAHRLGVLFITLALGMLTDLTKPMLSTEAEKCHQLARASLSLDPICGNPTIFGLQCMISITWYLRSAPTRVTSGYIWAFGGILLKLGSSIGLFRDSRKWLKDIDEIEMREALCWELLCLEVWQSFSAGRPCNIDFSLVDCRRPPETATASWGLPGFIKGYEDWRHRLAPIINHILLVVQRPGPVKYAEILNLELQLRECQMPDGLSIPLMSTPDQGLPEGDTTKHLQRLTALIMRESACCLLHRRFLVLAMQDVDEPTKTPYWYSAFQAGYSACWIVKAHCTMYQRHPELISRVPVFWSTSFSAAVVLGAIVARYWNRDFAKGTLGPFELICTVFEEAAGSSIQPLNSLEILRRLRQRVHAHFPTSSAAAKSFNDLPLLGAQPSITGFTSGHTATKSGASPKASTGRPSPRSNVSSSRSFTNRSIRGEPAMAPVSLGTPPAPTSTDTSPAPDPIPASFFGSDAELDAIWSTPDLRLFLDNNSNSNSGGVPFSWPNGQVWQPSLPDGENNAPVENFTPAVVSSTPETGQWNQFLDRLGVWE